MIDSDNYEASGIKVLQFPGGEWHAEVPQTILGHVHVFAKIRSWDDFGKFLAVTDAFKRSGRDVHVFMPYAPGARQDRVQEGFPLTSVIYPKAMRGSVDSLTFVDVHSEAAYLNYARNSAGSVRDIGFNHIPSLIKGSYSAVLAADEGGMERAEKIQKLLRIPNIRYCKKVRDSKTGKLSKFEVPDLSGFAHLPVLIADDICDGGGTFIGIAEEIYNSHPRHVRPELHLYVTHGIFSKGLDYLFTWFHKIYTTNSWYHPYDDRIKMIDLYPYYIESLTP